MSSSEMIEIDGSVGEGGGQILRTSLALSIITGKPFHLRNVRKNRQPKPGLGRQHLTCVEAARTICNGTTTGASIGSTDLTFTPGEVAPGRYHFQIGTAGSTCLVLHTVYLPLMWKTNGPSEIVIEGGTHNEKAPSFHFLDITWRWWLKKIGLDVYLEMRRPGFYPTGGGLIIAHLQPTQEICPLNIESPPEDEFQVVSLTANLPEHVTRRQELHAAKRIREVCRNVRSFHETAEQGMGSFVGVTVMGEVPALFGGIGARGKPAERVADDACDEAIAFWKQQASVDEHSSDQLLLPLVFAEGESRYRVGQFSSHLVTNIGTIAHFLDRKIEMDTETSCVVVR